MPEVRLTPEAAEELEQAAIWYEQECAGLGEKFIDAVESAIALLKEEFPPLVPLEGEAARQGVKQLLLHRFPFSLMVMPDEKGMIVLAVAHQHRKPFYWRNRTDA